MTAADILSLVLALAGLLGALARSALTVSQPFLSRKTVSDAIVGAFVGVLWPLFPLIPFPAEATMLHKAAIVAALAYLAGDVFMNSLTRLTGALRTLSGNGVAKLLLILAPLAMAFAGCARLTAGDIAIWCQGKATVDATMLLGRGTIDCGEGFAYRQHINPLNGDAK